MGGRGSFKDISGNDFDFTENGKTYHSIGEIDGVKILLRDKGLSVKAPEYSHTKNRIYAIIQNGELKHLTFYGEDHAQKMSIDFCHFHHGLKPHKHLNLNHNDTGLPITKEEENLANKIRRRFGLK